MGRNQLRSFLCVSLLSLGLSTFAMAGGDASGGGDAIVCGKKGAFSSRTVNLADTADLLSDMRGSFWNLLGFRYSMDTALGVELEILEKINPSLAAQVRETLPKLKFQFAEELEELNDDGLSGEFNKIVYTVKGQRLWKCHKTQLAIQDRNTGAIRVRKDLYDELEVADRALLSIHEAIIHLNPGVYDTTPLRRLVSEIFERSGFKDRSDPDEILNYLKTTLPNLSDKDKDYLVIFAAAISEMGRYGKLSRYEIEMILGRYHSHPTAQEFLQSYSAGGAKMAWLFGTLIENDKWNQILWTFIRELNERGVCGPVYEYFWTIDQVKKLSPKIRAAFRTKEKLRNTDIQTFVTEMGEAICQGLNQEK